MAKILDNPITEGLSGRLGRSRLQFRKGRNGKTIVALNPVFSEDRVFPESQLAQQEAFKQATQYAVAAKDHPIYVKLAKGAGATAYNFAVADWFGQPKVLEIDPSGWTGEIGQTIRILAKDDTHVESVQVVIDNAKGIIVEQGEAVRAEGYWWTYTTTSQVSQESAPRVTAVAKDLPGNAEGLAWQNN
jgi:hypothetical protein